MKSTMRRHRPRCKSWKLVAGTLRDGKVVAGTGGRVVGVWLGRGRECDTHVTRRDAGR